MSRIEDAPDWIDFRVDDVHGARIGRVEAVYVDRESAEPTWMLVRLPGLTEHHAVVPLDGVTVGAGHVYVPIKRDLVRAAPRVRPDRPLSPKQEAVLCRHYGRTPTRGAGAASWERRSAVVACTSPEQARSEAWRSGRAQVGTDRRTAQPVAARRPRLSLRPPTPVPAYEVPVPRIAGGRRVA